MFSVFLATGFFLPLLAAALRRKSGVDAERNIVLMERLFFKKLKSGSTSCFSCSCRVIRFRATIGDTWLMGRLSSCVSARALNGSLDERRRVCMPTLISENLSLSCGGLALGYSSDVCMETEFKHGGNCVEFSVRSVVPGFRLDFSDSLSCEMSIV